MIRPAREQSFSVPKVAPVETLGERLGAVAVVAPLRASIAETALHSPSIRARSGELRRQRKKTLATHNPDCAATKVDLTTESTWVIFAVQNKSSWYRP